MNGLYAMYAVATVIFSLAVQVAKPGHGHKTTLIAVDYIVLSYLFFFNSWFRNQVVIKLLERIKKD